MKTAPSEMTAPFRFMEITEVDWFNSSRSPSAPAIFSLPSNPAPFDRNKVRQIERAMDGYRSSDGQGFLC